jgi:hypothetical protein
MLALELLWFKKQQEFATLGAPAMWIEKLSTGVLRVLTPVGPRYIKPALSQRIYLLWIFRHFQMLPLQVLSLRQQQLIDALCAERRFVTIPQTIELEDSPVLGTVEWRPRVEAEDAPPSRPNGSVTAAVARWAGIRQRS